MSESDQAIHGYGTAVLEPPPYAIPSRKLTMWLFIISDAITFGALLFGYGYLRTASSDWPTPFKFNPSILNVMIMTVVLITSSLTMLGAVDSAKAGDKAKAGRFLWSTIFLGRCFRGPAHPGVVRPDRRRRALVSESLGLSTFWRNIFQHHRPAFAARDQWCGGAGGDSRAAFPRGRLTAGHVETTGLVLALCGFGLDVCRAFDLSVEPFALSRLGDIR